MAKSILADAEKFIWQREPALLCEISAGTKLFRHMHQMLASIECQNAYFILHRLYLASSSAASSIACFSRGIKISRFRLMSSADRHCTTPKIMIKSEKSILLRIIRNGGIEAPNFIKLRLSTDSRV